MTHNDYVIQNGEYNEYIEILYNTRINGYFDISDEALNLYNDRKMEIDSNFEPFYYCDNIKRDDPVLIEVFYELEEKFNSRHSLVRVHKIPQKYREHFSIQEYPDGTEEIFIYKDRYKLDLIENILCSIESNNEKLAKINEIFEEND